MKRKRIFVLALSVIFLLTVGCVKYNDKSADEQGNMLYCSECGYATTQGSKYCPNCGKEAKWVTEKPQVQSNNNQQANNSSNSNNETNNSSNNSNNNQSIQNKTNESSSNNQSSYTKTYVSKRNEYLNKLNQIEIEEQELAESTGSTTPEMRETSDTIYKKWDDMLNEIYSLIRKDLSSSQASELKRKEIAWIKYRDKKAENARDECGGGTLSTIEYVSSLSETTKERCYELVDEYMR